MKESLRDLMSFLLGNGNLIYNITLAAIFLIMGLSLLSAYRNRNKVVVKKAPRQKEKPMSSFKFFLHSSENGHSATNEDYFKYREEFEKSQEESNDEEEEEEPLTKWEFLAEAYCPKLIWGCVFSLVLMALVAVPYLVIRTFA